MITAVVVRPNPDGYGWFVFVCIDGGPEIVSGVHQPLIDMSGVAAEVARQTTRMLLEHEWVS